MQFTIPETVRAVVGASDLGKPSVVDIPFNSRSDIQNLGPHSIVVLNRAIGLNPTDYKHAHGDWSSKSPVVIGSDGAGVAAAVGEGVKHIRQGDRVAGMLHGASSTVQGTASEGYTLDAAHAWAMPDGMSYAEGASFSTLYMRWDLARPSAPLPKDSGIIVLVWGVGHHAVQLLHLSGYKVFVTASVASHDRLRQLGASQCFDYNEPNVVELIKSAAGKDGVAAAYDTAASGDSTLQCIDAIGSSGGRVMSTLPPTDEAVKRRQDVQVEFVLVYTLMGSAFQFANAFDFPAMPADKEAAHHWVTQELPAILKGWQEGQGSPRYKAQNLRVQNGLDRVHEGLKVLGEGSYKAEKLVYTV